MAGKDDKRNDACVSAISKTLNKVEERLRKGAHCDSVAEGLANVAKASELLSSVWTLPPGQLLRFHHDMRLTQVDGGATPGFDGNKEDAERFITISSSEIARYQRLMYANGVKGSRRRLLIILQGMDASGKGGIVRHVFSQGDPMGMHYHGFGAPKGEEKDHDYLWRIRRELPRNGWISIFDRSQYEDIVMPRVYRTYPEEVWQARYDEINRFEAQLVGDGCAIIKIFLVVSKDEQKRHFLSRLEDPTKYWKFDPSDLEARARWDDYMAVWQDVFARTSTERAPWYLVPADNRWYSRAVVSELLRNTLKNMNMIWPPLEVDADEMRRQLETL